MLREFANGTLRALVVSDVAARGLDLPGCDAVINLELPSDAAHYAHRAGRTGRAGRSGIGLSEFVKNLQCKPGSLAPGRAAPAAAAPAAPANLPQRCPKYL